MLHDRLIPFEALRETRADALVIDVGKIGGGEQVPQEATNALLLEHARAGRSVVRLKGGDPFVFGRGGEEAQLLHAPRACRSRSCPGITAGIAAAAYAGVPVTQRGMASAVAFVTGHEDPRKPESSVDWPALAAFPGTLVFYMGMRALPRIAQRLTEEGRSADEPVAVVERGHDGRPARRHRHAGRHRRARARRRASGRRRSRSSAPVAGLRDELAWRERRPLAGRRIVVTRARAAGERARRDAHRPRRRSSRRRPPSRSTRSTSSSPT